MLSRRKILQACYGGASAALLASPGNTTFLQAAETDQPGRPKSLAPADDQFLEELEQANFQFFWEQADPHTGLVKDRARVNGTGKGPAPKEIVASIAATGFGLTALCIGHKRGYVPLASVGERVLTTLEFLSKKMPSQRGFFYHGANISTGERIWDAEVSSIDTAILLCGVLTCREYFGHPEIRRLANLVFERVDWTWVAEDTTLLSHGWTPEIGFLPYRWDYYSELIIMYLLGMGSSSHPLDQTAWSAWKRTTFEYAGLRYIGSYAPLFVHQYPQAWFDLRGKRDRYADYFKNSQICTEVHRRFCLDLAARFRDYSDDLWGITASDSQHGYVVWGGPPEIGPIDGTVAPSAAGGSLPFMPEATLRVLKNIKNNYGPRVWSRYGFVNAFNPLKDWYDTDVVGIDTGITMLMAENLRTGFVWDTFMRSREAQRGLQRAGFQKYT